MPVKKKKAIIYMKCHSNVGKQRLIFALSLHETSQVTETVLYRSEQPLLCIAFDLPRQAFAFWETKPHLS